MAKCLARQMGQFDCAQLLSRTLGEEESADFLLTAIADPILQQVSLDDIGGSVNLDLPGEGGQKAGSARKKKGAARPERHAA